MIKLNELMNINLYILCVNALVILITGYRILLKENKSRCRGLKMAYLRVKNG